MTQIKFIKLSAVKKTSFLLGFLIFLSLFFLNLTRSKISPFSSLSPSILLEVKNENNIFNESVEELLRGNKIKGEFKSTENNLGIILIRFNTFDRINSDKLFFRIKEEGDSKWYYEYQYKSNQFQNNQYFTFGFPKIDNSANKIYDFEVESEKGKSGDAISLSSRMPNLAVAYQFSTVDFRKDVKTLLRFSYKKFFYAITHLDFILGIKVYLLVSFLLYVFIFIFKNKKNLRQIIMEIFNSSVRLIVIFFTIIWNGLILLVNKTKKYQEIISKIIFIFLTFLNKKFKKYFIIIGVFVIISVALITRISYYLDPKNFDSFTYSQIGGAGDYDQLLRHAMRFTFLNNLSTYYWSFINDYAINIRFFSVFFNFFGFIKGLNYSIYCLMLISSVVCLLPFIILSNKNRISLGGFIGSLLLAINSTYIWLTPDKALDVLTSLFFSIFIIFYIYSLKKDNFLTGFLLGVAGFMDMFNRPVMILNDLPALLIFPFIFLCTKVNFKWQFKSSRFRKGFIYFFKEYVGNIFLEIKIRYLVYSIYPLFIFSLFYGIWNIYYLKVFKEAWPFSPAWIFTTWNPIKDQEKILGELPLEKAFHFFLSFNLAIEKIPVYANLPILFLVILIIFIFFAIRRKVANSTLKKKNIIYFLILPAPILYIIFLYFLRKILILHPFFNLDLSKVSVRYFVDLGGYDFIILFLFIEIVILQLFFLGKEFIKYLVIILVYLLMVSYGLYSVFSERHYIQILLILFVLVGLTIDKLLVNDSDRKKSIFRAGLRLSIVMLFLFIVISILKYSQNLIFGELSKKKQITYLKYVATAIPNDGIILVSTRDGENVIWVSEYTKRPVIFNINNPNPVLILPGKGYFHMPISTKRPFTRYNFSDELNTDLRIDYLSRDYDKFNRYKFFVLDYDLAGWIKILKDKASGHPFLSPGIFELKSIGKGNNNRPVYQLIMKETDFLK